MPNWRVHLEIAKKTNEQLHLNDNDYNLFLLGNIAPDINNGFIVKSVSHIYNHEQTHFYNQKNHSTYSNFYEKYKSILKTNPVVLGYFIHLYADYLLNKSYKQKCEQNNFDKDEYIKFKHRDLKKYDSKYIENVITLKDYTEAIKDLQQIEEISINEHDLSNVIKFLANKETETESDIGLEFYTLEELDKEIEDITNEIYKFINLQ